MEDLRGQVYRLGRRGVEWDGRLDAGADREGHDDAEDVARPGELDAQEQRVLGICSET